MSLETKEELIANVKEWIKIDAEIATFKSEIKNRLAKKKNINGPISCSHEEERNRMF